MIKHISKVIKETELYRELQQRNLEEFLPGVSKVFLSIGFEGLPIRTHKKSQKDVYQRKNDANSEST
jgi:hypothetical protein